MSDDALRQPRGTAQRAPDVFRKGGWVPMREYPVDEEVDFAIVGTGAGGATLACRLAEQGFKVVAFDAPHASATIKRLNAESKAQREARETAEAKLQGFAGIDDPEHARKALETLRNLDDKKLIDAGEVEKVKREAKEAFDRQFEAQYKPIEAERNALKSQLHNERLSTAFGRSKFIADKLAVPVDIVQARFGAHFGIGDDGKIMAKGPDGNPLYSRARPGEEAGFDEALELCELPPFAGDRQQRADHDERERDASDCDRERIGGREPRQRSRERDAQQRCAEDPARGDPGRSWG